jgi:hypothetical protein
MAFDTGEDASEADSASDTHLPVLGNLLLPRMTYQPGILVNALVRDGKGDQFDAVVYLSLIVPGDNGPRRDHCWRYAPPSNEVVRGYVTPGDYVQVQHKTIS